MNRSERSDVPFVPSQIAQPEGGSIVTLPSAPRLNAEGGGNQAITVLTGVPGAFAPDVAMVMTPALELPDPAQVRLPKYGHVVETFPSDRPRAQEAVARALAAPMTRSGLLGGNGRGGERPRRTEWAAGAELTCS